MESTSPAAPSESTAPGLRLKVCGMKYAANIAEVAALKPDFMGFIFHAGSARYVGQELDAALLRRLPAGLRTVGVFVDADTEYVLAQVRRYGLDLAQLHGHEPPAQCAALQAAGVAVIKAFAVGSSFDQRALEPYVPYCSYFLFDTKGPQPGGNGTAFDWRLLRDYHLPVPYLLAGGLELANAPELLRLPLPGLLGLDLNSRFETAPARKDAGQLEQMFGLVRRPHSAAVSPAAR
ncbi:phosphoribosylanthranilate isomerase [Hymenobacter algoricola]|uniref:N-(5'-phosphoribosyl)anthranilate isomerase n=1 Tax=Hymenobacter algoricola TaxID=486267 RepID=A0ABP7MTG1_9BACT